MNLRCAVEVFSIYDDGGKRESMAVYAVILAGGSGKRLWPLSRATHPKQLLRCDDRTFLEHAIDRARKCVAEEHIVVVTTKAHEEKIRIALVESNFGGTVLIEPIGRNTAAAIIWSAHELATRDSEAVLFIMPADHIIEPIDRFAAQAREMLQYVSTHEKIMLFGITPTYPSTAYGYIECSAGAEHYAPVASFHEKPDSVRAAVYCDNPLFLWNSGMLCARACVILAEAEKYDAPIFSAVLRWCITGHDGDYASIPARSFDKSVLEKSTRCVMLAASFSWTDIGNLETFIAASKMSSRLVEHHARDTAVYVHDKLVVVVGVDDLCIVETPDVLVVARRDSLNAVQQVVDNIAQSSYRQYWDGIA